MLEWRIGRGWSDEELASRLAAAAQLRRNFDDPPEDLTPARGWGRHASEAIIGREAAGPPVTGGPFERAWPLVEAYAFSDPRIVVSHFIAGEALEGRRMLLEIRVLGLRFLAPVVVGAVRRDASGEETVRGFRYDTLEGHVERGSEWFLVCKDHRSGDIRFRIRAGWRRGELPNVVIRTGFRLLARRYQRAWHRLAHLRLRKMLGSTGLPPLPRGRRLVHEGRALELPVVPALVSSEPPSGIASEADVPEPADSPPS